LLPAVGPIVTVSQFCWNVLLQCVSFMQSELAEHPQYMPPAPLRQTGPYMQPAVQLVQKVPKMAQSSFAPPSWQVLVPKSQQPPLHGFVVPHEVVQAPPLQA
jgi:hypothetical protein